MILDTARHYFLSLPRILMILYKYVYTTQTKPQNKRSRALTFKNKNQWGNTKKTLILTVCALYSFLGNSSLLGPSVYIAIFSEEFEISPNTASGLISYANLAFGFGELSQQHEQMIDRPIK